MESICRACRSSLESGSIEVVDRSKRFDCFVWEMMCDCTLFDVTIDDGFPKKICLDCLNRLEACYSFVKMCRESMDFFLASSEDRKLEGPNTDFKSLVTTPNTDFKSLVITPNTNRNSSTTSESEQTLQFNSLLVPLKAFDVNEVSHKRVTRSKQNGLKKGKNQFCSEQQPKPVSKKRHKGRTKEIQILDSKERNCLRTKMWRTNRTPEQAMAEREKNRIRMSMIRKTNRDNQSSFSEEQSELGERNRMKTSSWRAKQTPEQAMAEREKNRRRIAAIRAAKRSNAQGLERDRLENRLMQAMRRAKKKTEELMVVRKIEDSDGYDSS